MSCVTAGRASCLSQQALLKPLALHQNACSGMGAPGTATAAASRQAPIWQTEGLPAKQCHGSVAPAWKHLLQRCRIVGTAGKAGRQPNAVGSAGVLGTCLASTAKAGAAMASPCHRGCIEHCKMPALRRYYCALHRRHRHKV